MYSDWISSSSLIQNYRVNASTVLHKFPDGAGKEVACGLVQHLSADMGVTGPNKAKPSHLVTEHEVHWCMEVLGYGLGLPLTEHDTIRDCVSVYCEWLSCLHQNPKISVPQPVKEDPNLFARKMMSHLYHLFVPRPSIESDINRQAVLCHRVLRTLQGLAQQSTSMSQETWEALLLFLIAVNDVLLSPPTSKEDFGHTMCERVLSVLFEVWLLACHKCFPTPSLWKTLKEVCMNWRHRSALISQWNKINYALTHHLLKFMYGPEFSSTVKLEEYGSLTPAGMADDTVAQSWYRLLHVIGNPVELCYPTILSRTEKFLTYVINSDEVLHPCHHECLKVLPNNFNDAMKGIATLVDAFLGQGKPKRLQERSLSMSATIPHFSSTTTASADFKATSPLSLVDNLAPGRPRCNSILHLFGGWLYEAALVGCDIPAPGAPSKRTNRTESFGKRAYSIVFDPQPNAQAIPDSMEIPDYLTIDKFQAGRAEAIGTLCRIFSAKKTGEEILPVYLVRFYICVQQGLKRTEPPAGEVIASILINSTDLFHLDLDGVNVLLPHFIRALEDVLPHKQSTFRSSISTTELRRACIKLLLSFLVLPHHFNNLPIKELLGPPVEHQTFLMLKPRLVNLMINALQTEDDSTNTQMLLGGLLMCVQDSALFEQAVQQVTQHDYAEPGMDSPSPLLMASSESAQGLLTRSVYLVCHRLISSWKTDLAVSLAALELLSGLARIRLAEQGPLEVKRAVKWVCDYVAQQCGRPPREHSRDVHSSILAALQCLGLWLTNQPTLLSDQEALNMVLEVIELGISGTKSRPKPSEPPTMKQDKELRPVSMRVRDAAEALLALILEQVGYFPLPTGPASLSALVDEESLLRHCNLTDISMEKESGISFKYFAINNSIMLALLEQPLGNEQDPQPSLTLILRGPHGRSCWHMQLRHLPRSKSSTRADISNPGRPVPMDNLGKKWNVIPKYFPPKLASIPKCKADRSIPSIEQVVEETGLKQEHERMKELIEQQYQIEEQLRQRIEGSPREYPDPDLECKPPKVCQEFQTARLFLSSLGFLNPVNLKETIDNPVPGLVALDSHDAEFRADLKELDMLSCRTFDTVHVFYVRAGQRHASDILNNVSSSRFVSPHFLEVLLSMGWPVNVHRHPGWTGHISTSWKVSPSPPHEEPPVPDGDGGRMFNGDEWVVYWADTLSEIAFVVPSPREQTKERTPPTPTFRKQMPSPTSLSEPLPPPRRRAHTTDNTKQEQHEILAPHLDTRHRSSGRNQSKLVRTRVILVWLECFEDHRVFPLRDLMEELRTGMEEEEEDPGGPEKDVFVIFAHALTNGLFRIHFKGHQDKFHGAIPLVDGMVLSRRALGCVVRQTAINLANRHRLHADRTHPHARRKLKIQDCVKKYRIHMDEPEFCTYLFTNEPPKR